MASLWLFVLLLCAGASAASIGTVGPECAACGFIMNELEGFVAEPRTEAEISAFIANDICPLLSGKYLFYCKLASALLPSLILKAESQLPISGACIELGMCKQNLTNTPDMGALPRFTLSLDDPPQTRWTAICRQPYVGQFWNSFLNIIRDLLPATQNGTRINQLGETIWLLLPQEYALEIQGCAAAANVQLGWFTMVNIAYELQEACTSIVAQGSDGTIIHARNLDFGMGGFLTQVMRELASIVEFTKGGQVVSRQTSFLGFIGVLSGQQLGKFTVTVNTRYYQGGVKKSIRQTLDQFIWAIQQFPHARLAAFLARDALQYTNSFSEAVDMLTKTELIADIYYTVSGVNPGEGVVISRNRTGASNVWPLWSSGNTTGPGSWYVLQTNYDHTKGAPWFDDRMDAGYAAMNQMGQKQASLNGLLNVLSTKPVLNLLTTISLVAVNSNSSYASWTRACQFPCAL